MEPPEGLHALVDAGRFDDVVEQVGLDGIATAWFAYMRETKPASATTAGGKVPFEDFDPPNWWAVEIWMDDTWWTADEQRVRLGILELVALADSDDDFGNLGASIMETFASRDESRLQWIAEEAATSEGFRRSLAHVRVWGELPDPVAARIEQAAGTPLPRPTHTLLGGLRAYLQRLRTDRKARRTEP